MIQYFIHRTWFVFSDGNPPWFTFLKNQEFGYGFLQICLSQNTRARETESHNLGSSLKHANCTEFCSMASGKYTEWEYVMLMLSMSTFIMKSLINNQENEIMKCVNSVCKMSSMLYLKEPNFAPCIIDYEYASLTVWSRCINMINRYAVVTDDCGWYLARHQSLYLTQGNHLELIKLFGFISMHSKFIENFGPYIYDIWPLQYICIIPNYNIGNQLLNNFIICSPWLRFVGEYEYDQSYRWRSARLR